jgi:hypothetical protein
VWLRQYDAMTLMVWVQNTYIEITTYGQRLILERKFLIGSSPDGGASLLFDFPYGGVNVDASSYIEANTNLFYMNICINMVLMRRAGTFNKIIMEKAEKLQILFILMPKILSYASKRK